MKLNQAKHYRWKRMILICIRLLLFLTATWYILMQIICSDTGKGALGQQKEENGGAFGRVSQGSFFVADNMKDTQTQVQLQENGSARINKEAATLPALALHAKSACIMDADTLRILYGKNQEQPLAMASTTKVMTLLVLLENASPKEEVVVSTYASGQPKVRLGMSPGQRFYFQDLCYSLMLCSHNDSAVALAEHVGAKLLGETVSEGDSKEASRKRVEAFVGKMNEKAKQLGLKDTYYVTPNGLDAEREGKQHHSTAEDLCLVMANARNNEQFLDITRTKQFTIWDLDRHRTYNLSNYNRLLFEDRECVSGKTGFTGNAGYCYVAAIDRGEKHFLVAVLASGWPPDKKWKWEDVRKLVDYANQTYEFREVGYAPQQTRIEVKNGRTDSCMLEILTRKQKVLMREDETVQIQYLYPKSLVAPVNIDRKVGMACYRIGSDVIAGFPIRVMEEVKENGYIWKLETLWSFFLGSKSHC